jgi:hypothetical protein
MKTSNRTCAGEAGSHMTCPWAKTAFAGGKARFTYSWCWVTFGEQSMVISRERRSYRDLGKWLAQSLRCTAPCATIGILE